MKRIVTLLEDNDKRRKKCFIYFLKLISKLITSNRIIESTEISKHNVLQFTVELLKSNTYTI